MSIKIINKRNIIDSISGAIPIRINGRLVDLPPPVWQPGGIISPWPPEPSQFDLNEWPKHPPRRARKKTEAEEHTTKLPEDLGRRYNMHLYR